jgi:hypothetical protein
MPRSIAVRFRSPVRLERLAPSNIAFPSPVEVGYVDARHWKVIVPFECDLELDGRQAKISVAAGFVTDFATIPRIFWSIAPPEDAYSEAACVHDYLYACSGVLPGISPSLSREECDQVLLVGMQALGVPYWKREPIYKAVRWFGAGHFGKAVAK